MPVTVTTDHAIIGPELDRLVAADPVRGTLMATIRMSLEDTAWAAFYTGGLAVRSSVDYPVAIAGEWAAEARAELVDLLRQVPSLRGLSGVIDVVTAVARDLVG